MAERYYPEKALQSHIQSLLYFWRGNGYCGPLKRNELFKVSDALLNLQRGLTGDRKLAGTETGSYMQNDGLLGAYLLYYWPVSFLQIQHAALSVENNFNELIDKRLSTGSKALRILDLGSGPGPAGAALVDLIQHRIGDKSKLPVELTLYDYSSKALGLAKKIFARDFSNVSVDAQSINFEKNDLPLEEKKFDIIITNHCLNELWKNSGNCIELRSKFIASAAEHLSEDGLLFLCEPALLLTSRALMQVRDNLKTKDFTVVAPCPCNCTLSTCPALKAGDNQTCHAEISWKPVEPVASIAQNAKLDRNSVKMTYFVFRKNSETSADENKSELNIQADKSSAAPLKEIAGVVVSDGMVNKAGRTRFVICNGSERITVSAKNGDAAATEKKFFTLKRYDSVSIKNPEIRGDKNNISYGISAETEIEIKRF